MTSYRTITTEWPCAIAWSRKERVRERARDHLMMMAKKTKISQEGLKAMYIRCRAQSDMRDRWELFFPEKEDRDQFVRVAKVEGRLGNNRWHCKRSQSFEERRKKFKKVKHPKRFSVMTWNVHGIGCPKRRDLTAPVLRKNRPSVVLMQETTRRRQRWQGDENFRIRLGDCYAGEEVLNEKGTMEKAKRGLATLIDTRIGLKMERLETVPLDAYPFILITRVSGLACGGSVMIFNIYVAERKRTKIFQWLGQLLGKYRAKYPEDRLVIGGDFNERGHSVTKRMAKIKNTENMVMARPRKAITYHTPPPWKGVSDIDHLFYSDGFSKPRAKVDRATLNVSDHWPLTIRWDNSKDIAVKPQARTPIRMDAMKIKAKERCIATHNRFQALADLIEKDDNKVDKQDLAKKFVETSWTIAREEKVTSGGGPPRSEMRKKTAIQCCLDKKTRKAEKKWKVLNKKYKKKRRTEARKHRMKELKKEIIEGYRNARRRRRNYWFSSFGQAYANSDWSGVFQWMFNQAGVARGRSNDANRAIKDPTSGELITDNRSKAQVTARYFASLAEDPDGRSKDPSKWRHWFDDWARWRVREEEDKLREEGSIREVLLQIRNDTGWIAQEQRRTHGREVPADQYEVGNAGRAREIAWRRVVFDEINWKCIYPLRIKRYLLDSARRKSPGIDGITNEWLRSLIAEDDKPELEKDTEDRNEVTPGLKVLTAVLDEAWQNALVYEEWNSATVVPVPKKGDLTDLNNFRGIALMSNLVKIINGRLAEDITRLVHKHRLLDNAQAGFINREEAVAQASCLYEICEMRRLKNKETFLCFIDLTKAYDRVSHEALMIKLELFGIHGKALKWIKALYKDPKICCRDGEGGQSELQPYKRGVRQGDPLSPILFDIFIDDLLSAELHNEGVTIWRKRPIADGWAIEREKVKMGALLFADDIVLMAKSEEKLRNLCERVSKWCDTWGMEVNASKCGVMKIQKSRPSNDDGLEDNNQHKLRVQLQGQQVPNVDEYTYLGVVITPDLSEEKMIKHRLRVTKQKIREYSKLIKSPMVSLEAKAMCLKSIIIPTLVYGGEIWGKLNRTLSKAERTIAEAMKSVARIPRSGSNFIVSGELEMRTIREIIMVMKLRLLNKAHSLITPLSIVRNEDGGRVERGRELKNRVKDWYFKHKVDEKVREELERRRLKANISRKKMRDLQISHEKSKKELEEKRTRRLTIPYREEEEENEGEMVIWKDKVRSSLITANTAAKESERDMRDYEETYHDITRQIAKEVYGRKSKEASVNEKRYENGAMLIAKYLRRCGVDRSELAYGWTILMRMRVGRYWNTQRLIRARVVRMKKKNGNGCPFCKREESETDAHIIFKCDMWEDERSDMMERIPMSCWIAQEVEIDHENWHQNEWTINTKRFIAAVLNFSIRDVWKNEGMADEDVEEEESMVGPTVKWCLSRETEEWKDGIISAIVQFLRRVSPARFSWLRSHGYLDRE